MHPSAPAQPRNLAGYFEELTRVVFQAGLSWQVVESKWPDLRVAFHGFDPETIADLTPPAVDALMADPRVIRNRRKIDATIDNARTLLALDAEHGGFVRYLQSQGGFSQTIVDMRRRFKFLGENGAYHFLWVVGEPVPPYEEWCATHKSA